MNVAMENCLACICANIYPDVESCDGAVQLTYVQLNLLKQQVACIQFLDS